MTEVELPQPGQVGQRGRQRRKLVVSQTQHLTHNRAPTVEHAHCSLEDAAATSAVPPVAYRLQAPQEVQSVGSYRRTELGAWSADRSLPADCRAAHTEITTSSAYSITTAAHKHVLRTWKTQESIHTITHLHQSRPHPPFQHPQKNQNHTRNTGKLTELKESHRNTPQYLEH